MEDLTEGCFKGDTRVVKVGVLSKASLQIGDLVSQSINMLVQSFYFGLLRVHEAIWMNQSMDRVFVLSFLLLSIFKLSALHLKSQHIWQRFYPGSL